MWQKHPEAARQAQGGRSPGPQAGVTAYPIAMESLALRNGVTQSQSAIRSSTGVFYSLCFKHIVSSVVFFPSVIKDIIFSQSQHTTTHIPKIGLPLVLQRTIK